MINVGGVRDDGLEANLKKKRASPPSPGCPAGDRRGK